MILVDDQSKCPICENLPIIEGDLAKRRCHEKIDQISGLFHEYLKQFDKNGLIAHIAWAREKFARDFFQEYKGFHLTKFLTYNLLMKEIAKDPNIKGRSEANEKNVKQLVDTYEKFVDRRELCLDLENGFYSMIDGRISEAGEVAGPVEDTFSLVPNETYLPIRRSFENNGILSQEDCQRRIDQYKIEIGTVDNSLQKRSYTTDEFIETFYTVILQLYCGLLRNAMYVRVFNFDRLKEIAIIPSRIIEFVNTFQLVDGIFTECNVQEFSARLQKFFRGRRPNLIERALVFSSSNADIFPWFVRVEDHIFVSHRTSYLVFALLHAILHKDKFDEETKKRSLEFEKREVEQEFRGAAFDYRNDLKNRSKDWTLQIDGIATQANSMFIVECKGWGLKALYERKETQRYLERDLKGIVDGLKYTTKNGRLQTTKRPSLLEKIDFAKNNMNIWGYDPKQFSEVQGLIVMRDFSPIREYKGIRIVSMREIPLLRTK